MKNYRDLNVWKSGHAVTLEVYRQTKSFPKEELFGITSQMRRAASSIPANLAEGCGREGDAELKRFVNIALGSAYELDYFALLASELGYLNRKLKTILQPTSSYFVASLARSLRNSEADDRRT